MTAVKWHDTQPQCCRLSRRRDALTNINRAYDEFRQTRVNTDIKRWRRRRVSLLIRGWSAVSRCDWFSKRIILYTTIDDAATVWRNGDEVLSSNETTWSL